MIKFISKSNTKIENTHIIYTTKEFIYNKCHIKVLDKEIDCYYKYIAISNTKILQIRDNIHSPKDTLELNILNIEEVYTFINELDNYKKILANLVW